MKILYYDCFCGISGDMNLGALLDAGVDESYLRGELEKLGLNDEFKIEIQKGGKNGIAGTKVDVVLKRESGSHHRHLADIEKIIMASGLGDNVKKMIMDMFRRIAEAEGKVHGLPAEEVHFHEVGAIDSIVDLVGAAIALDYLRPDVIMASTVQLGGGFVNCAHGKLPVPAPATAELLRNIPVKTGLVPFETTTPTGAAILAANVSRFSDQACFSVQKVGYGLGSRDLEVANVLRVFIGETAEAPETAEQFMLETNIDDMNPELFGFVEERLFEAGALDVFKTPVIMKKGRPGVLLSVLTDKRNEDAIEKVIFSDTTAIGLRKIKVDKIMLQRKIEQLHTKLGDVKIKKAYYEGRLVNCKPEYEDCKKIAETNKIPITQVYREIDKEMERQTPKKPFDFLGKN